MRPLRIFSADHESPPPPPDAPRAREQPILTERHLIGAAAVAVALAVTVYGYRLGRRYGTAIDRTAIGRSHSPRHSALAVLGNALVILGLIGVMLAVMLGFF